MERYEEYTSVLEKKETLCFPISSKLQIYDRIRDLDDHAKHVDNRLDNYHAQGQWSKNYLH